MEKERDLKDKVRDYWELSSLIHGGPTNLKTMTVESAISYMNDLLGELSPARPVWLKVANLQHTLVEYGSPKRNRSKVKADILQMIRKQPENKKKATPTA